MPTPILFATKDNAEGQLASGINASATSIPLGTGEGAEFPQPYRGTASSAGSATTLNDTGDLGSVEQYKVIRNVTDGSWAIVLTTGTNSITTTRLRGGSDNTWQSGDEWRVDEFEVFFEAESGGVVTKREKALIIDRSGDTLTVATGGRGYDGSSAQSFSTNDYVRLHVASKTVEEIIKALADLVIAENTLNTDLNAAESDIDNLESGASNAATATGSSDAYAITVSPAPVAYAENQVFRFKANFTNTGSATLDVNSLGATTIKKLDGATDLSAGDIESGQIVVVQYDGTNFQMLSPSAILPTQQYNDRTVHASTDQSSTIGTSSTSQQNFDTHTVTVPQNTLVAGVGYEFECGIATDWNSGNITFAVRLGNVDIASCTITPSATSNVTVIRGFIMGTAAAGASVNVKGLISVSHGGLTNAKTASGLGSGAAVATNADQTLQFSGQYSASSGSHGMIMAPARIRKFATSLFT